MLDKVALKRSTFLVENLFLDGKLEVNLADSTTRNGMQVFANDGDKILVSADLKLMSNWIRGSFQGEAFTINGLVENEYTKNYYIREYDSGKSSKWAGYYGSLNNENKIKNRLTINLTQTFGAGNEPTTKQMDELLSQFDDGWFDGTKNVFNAEHILKMYFNKTKELDNAITSLGGSI